VKYPSNTPILRFRCLRNDFAELGKLDTLLDDYGLDLVIRVGRNVNDCAL